jgi:hypothetical protein
VIVADQAKQQKASGPGSELKYRPRHQFCQPKKHSFVVQVLLPFTSPLNTPFSHVEASITGAENGHCRMVYRITGHTLADGAPLCLPARCAKAGFADELWQHTCCEAFVATVGQTAYREFNFSPSGQWAIYDFADYRQAMRPYQPDVPPKIDCQPTPDGFVLTVDLPRTLLGPPPWQIGLSCILKYHRRFGRLPGAQPCQRPAGLPPARQLHAAGG